MLIITPRQELQAILRQQVACTLTCFFWRCKLLKRKGCDRSLIGRRFERNTDGGAYASICCCQTDSPIRLFCAHMEAEIYCISAGDALQLKQRLSAFTEALILDGNEVRPSLSFGRRKQYGPSVSALVARRRHLPESAIRLMTLGVSPHWRPTLAIARGTLRTNGG